MKPLYVFLAVSLATLTFGCLVDVPEPDGATFACTDNTDCAGGYRCYGLPSGNGVCVSEEGCSSDADCGGGEHCVPGEGVCLPEVGCTKNEDCPNERPYCNLDRACTDPCAEVDCHEKAADTVCVVDLGFDEGYQCLACEANPEACGPGRECVRSNAAPDFRCAAACSTAGEPCSDGGAGGLCAEVEGIMPGGSSSSLAVCAVCDQGCSGATPECMLSFPNDIAPNLESAAACQPAGGPCESHSDCGTSNYCAVQSGGAPNICVGGCATVESGCEDINGQSGWCVDADTAGGGSAQVCGSCPATCDAAYEDCGSWPDMTTVDQAVGCVCVDNDTCAGKNGSAFRCRAGECTDVCDWPGDTSCPDLHVCRPENVCSLCGNGKENTGEACDDGDPDGGYCRGDCLGPQCDWGLKFSSQGDVAQVLFEARPEHYMGVSGFTIDLWARVIQAPAELVSRPNDDDGNAPYYRLLVNGNWGIEFHVSDDNGNVTSATSNSNTVTGGVRRRITAVRHTDGSTRVEVGGSIVATGSRNSATNIEPTGGLRLGYFPNGALARDLEMDNVRIFNKALSADDLNNVQRCDHSADGALVGEWLFDMAGAPNGPSGVVDTSDLPIREVNPTGDVAFANVPEQ